MTTPRLAIAAATAMLTLSGCSARTPEPAMPPKPSMEPSCGADELSAYIGRQATDDVIAAIRAWRGEHPVRVLKPGSIATMDYRPDRLNIDIDENGLIKRFRCT